MIDKQFKKEAFKESVKENVKFLYRKTLEEATQEQIFQAVSYTVKDVIIDNWLETQNAYQKQDPKIVYYMSMEFLMGRALGNNLLNLTAYGEVKEALEELGLDLNVIEDQEPDPALGNGGLGRLAACFLDSLATLNYCAYGCGIRYRYGMFKQEIKDGFQLEVPDNWLKNGYPFELRRPEYAKEVHFGGYVRVEYEEGLGWDEAWEVTTKCVAYTNHTIMSEALEKWPIELFSRLLPRVYQIIEEINRRFILEIQAKYPGNYEKIKKMAIIYDGQVKMAHLAIVAGFSVNGVARLHTEILKNQELKDFYEMMPEKFNNKTNGITQRRFLLHGNQLLADWVTDHIGPDWITDLSQISKLKLYVDDERAQQEFMNIKYQNKVRLAKYILEHNGVEVDPHSIFDVQVKRLHEYKRQLLNILHVIYLYDKIKRNPGMEFYPRTFIFGAKASAGYARAKKIIKLINSVADVVNNDKSIDNKIKVVFIENYRVSNAEMIFAAADVSEQISTASKEASGTGNMKFMLNGAPTLGTMDGANVEIVEEVGEENAFIFGLSSDEVINYENNGGYDPNVIYNTDGEIRQVLMELINGTFSNDTELFRDLYDSLLHGNGYDKADQYFILADFRAYAAAQEKVEEAYRDEKRWARMAMMNTACSGKFTSDRTIQEYVDDMWHLDKVIIK